jgi:hypothetical protein
MRGLGAGYTQMLVNGQRMHPAASSLEALAPDQIEKIEVDPRRNGRVQYRSHRRHHQHRAEEKVGNKGAAGELKAVRRRRAGLAAQQGLTLGKSGKRAGLRATPSAPASTTATRTYREPRSASRST